MDALAVWANEGRGVTAKLVGKVSSNLRSGGVRMGKPSSFTNYSKLKDYLLVIYRFMRGKRPN